MTNPDRNQAGRPRGGNGRFTASLQSAEAAAEACRLRSRGMTYQAIADELGYADPGGARRAVQRALAATVQEPAAEMRQLLLMQLEQIIELGFEILEADHPLVSHGRVVTDKDDKALPDHGPRLAAMDRIRQSNESMRKLLGLNAPERVEVLTDDVIDRELEKLRAKHGPAADGEADGAEEAPGGEEGTGTP